MVAGAAMIPAQHVFLSNVTEATGRNPDGAVTGAAGVLILTILAAITAYVVRLVYLSKPPIMDGFEIVRAKSLSSGDMIRLYDNNVKVNFVSECITPFGRRLELFLVGHSEPQLVRLNAWAYRRNVI